ncbi:MAG: helix-turn-helix transcriptional regulator [Clostridia bacterium]|nr:helix-turn-helix transcriptional regulator [Clostridia bacterium]
MGDEKLLKEIGQRINARRKELGLTQEELAERMEVSIQMISNVELGKKAIRPENLVKLCNALDVSADYILRGNRADWEAIGFMDKYARLSIENQHLLEKLAENLMK